MIESILDFYFSAKRFKGLADSPVDTRVLDSNIRRIREKSDEIADIGIQAYLVDSQEVLTRVARDFQLGTKPSSTTYNSKELKCLSYNLGNDSSYDFLDYCLKLLDHTWYDSYLRGLIHSLLIHWNDFDDGGRKLFCAFFKKKIDNSSTRYAGKIKPILGYLEISGPYKLGNKTRSDNKGVLSICGVFGLSSNRISYSYFSDAIVAYYEKIGNDEFPQLK